TWAGWILDYNNPFVLVAKDERIDHLTRALTRVGLDGAIGYITDDYFLDGSNFSLSTIKEISAEELNDNLSDYQIIDVRGYSEFKVARIPGAINIHAGELELNIKRLNKNKSTVVHCESGDRSSIASSFLINNGFAEVYNLPSGINGWIDSGFRVERGADSLAQISAA
ncbi:MAG: rhodanese-like domain-containing protein, partial [Melioribacteraceae bacterium]|nr:rhodanese-like domain-containing protein [Melioribacteraceae bacterium]